MTLAMSPLVPRSMSGALASVRNILSPGLTLSRVTKLLGLLISMVLTLAARSSLITCLAIPVNAT